MILIFEGHDLSGKSYFAEYMSKRHNIPILKKPLHMLKEQNKDFLQNVEIEFFSEFFWKSIHPLHTGGPVIVDRSLLSSMVFSVMYQRKYSLDYITDYLKSNLRDFKIFLFSCDDKTLDSRFSTRGEELFSLDEIKVIREQYKNVYASLVKNHLDHKIISIDNSDSQDVSSIITLLERNAKCL